LREAGAFGLSLPLKAIGMARVRKELASRACRERSVAQCPMEVLTSLPDGFRNVLPMVCHVCSWIDQPGGDTDVLGIGALDTPDRSSVKSLFLEVCGGLGNRLRTLVSGICLAEDLSCRLVLSWPYDNKVCYCRFEDLFDIGSLPSFATVIPCRLGSVSPCQSPTEIESRVAIATGSGDASLRLISNEQFHVSDQERWVRHLRALRPTQDILARVSEVLERAPGARTGILVRRHGHEKTTQESPLSEFLEPMRKEDPGTVFVVATDDDEAQACLENEFPGRCLFPARFRERDYHRSREGMKEVLVNFICLARCSRILGAYWSSFGYVAADYGGSELVEIRRSTSPSK
jgi:hypothetical protein